MTVLDRAGLAASALALWFAETAFVRVTRPYFDDDRGVLALFILAPIGWAAAVLLLSRLMDLKGVKLVQTAIDATIGALALHGLLMLLAPGFYGGDRRALLAPAAWLAWSAACRLATARLIAGKLEKDRRRRSARPAKAEDAAPRAHATASASSDPSERRAKRRSPRRPSPPI